MEFFDWRCCHYFCWLCAEPGSRCGVSRVRSDSVVQWFRVGESRRGLLQLALWPEVVSVRLDEVLRVCQVYLLVVQCVLKLVIHRSLFSQRIHPCP